MIHVEQLLCVFHCGYIALTDTFADVVNEALVDSVSTSGISSFDLTESLLW